MGDEAVNYLSIIYPDDEHVEVKVNGVVVAHADHDSDGWAGMDATTNAARGIADALGMVVIEE